MITLRFVFESTTTSERENTIIHHARLDQVDVKL